MVTTSGTLIPERRDINGSGMCHSENVPKERDICWAPTVGQHEKRNGSVGDIYGAGVLGLGDTIYSIDGKRFTETVCPTRGTWFGSCYVMIKTLDRSN